MPKKRLLSIFLTLSCSKLVAFESSKTLPKGVRNLNVKGLYTSTDKKSDPSGRSESLAVSLWKPLKFKNILSSEESPLKKTQLTAFLLEQGISPEQSVGDFRADLNAQITVWAPIIAWGLTDKLTLAAAIPYYSSSTDIAVGFKTNRGANDFLERLTSPSMNNYAAADEATEKFKDAVLRLNRKLIQNNYQELNRWNDSGWGDTTLAIKYHAVEYEIFNSSVTGGIVAPTGKVESPNILTDLAFGDGQWDLFTQVSIDEQITHQIFINQFIKYTYQSPDKRAIAWKTAEESIEIPITTTQFKLGDKIDAGASIQFEEELTGLNAGIGVLFFQKYQDRFKVDVEESKSELEKNSDQTSQYLEAKVGYSSLSAFRRKQFPIPLSISFEYKKQALSRNMPVTDFAQIDLNIYF